MVKVEVVIYERAATNIGFGDKKAVFTLYYETVAKAVENLKWYKKRYAAINAYTVFSYRLL